VVPVTTVSFESLVSLAPFSQEIKATNTNRIQKRGFSFEKPLF
jgi:hypothetical protein